MNGMFSTSRIFSRTGLAVLCAAMCVSLAACGGGEGSDGSPATPPAGSGQDGQQTPPAAGSGNDGGSTTAPAPALHCAP